MLTESPYYCGDVGYTEGGAWINISTFADGYCSTVRALEFDGGLFIVESLVVLTPETDQLSVALQDPKVVEAMRFCGIEPYDLYGQNWQRILAEELLSYGHYEPDDLAPRTPIFRLDVDSDHPHPYVGPDMLDRIVQAHLAYAEIGAS